MIQEINASKYIPEDEKRFYIQNVMVGPWSSATATMKEVEEAEHMYQDMEPTYNDSTASVLGCEHYVRACKQKCPTCSRMFTCHKCHDKQVQSHTMDRYQVDTLLCMRCGEEQVVGARCISPECAGQPDFSPNHCLRCRVYTHRPVFHCNDCDVCRVGRAEDFEHCARCSTCIQKDTFAVHRCVEGSHEANCPICHETMRGKQCAGSVVVTVCGHPMHEECLNAYVGHGSFKCPVCMHVLGDMSAQFNQLSNLIASQPMPQEYAAATALVRCVCCRREARVPFHFVGHQCPGCRSFNTTILSTEGLPQYDDLDGACDMSLDSEEEN